MASTELSQEELTALMVAVQGGNYHMSKWVPVPTTMSGPATQYMLSITPYSKLVWDNATERLYIARLRHVSSAQTSSSMPVSKGSSLVTHERGEDSPTTEEPTEHDSPHPSSVEEDE